VRWTCAETIELSSGRPHSADCRPVTPAHCQTTVAHMQSSLREHPKCLPIAGQPGRCRTGALQHQVECDKGPLTRLDTLLALLLLSSSFEFVHGCTCSMQGLKEMNTPLGARHWTAEAAAFHGAGRSRNTPCAGFATDQTPASQQSSGRFRAKPRTAIFWSHSSAACSVQTWGSRAVACAAILESIDEGGSKRCSRLLFCLMTIPHR